jgi:hypothetical protein
MRLFIAHERLGTTVDIESLDSDGGEGLIERLAHLRALGYGSAHHEVWCGCGRKGEMYLAFESRHDMCSRIAEIGRTLGVLPIKRVGVPASLLQVRR